jgi:molybdopterin/thiamine biosynthesis adenylyltransferase
MALTGEQQARYARHLSLPEIGAAGQAKLQAGRVLVIGAGGLGSPAAFYLAAAGVGTLGLIDSDVIELSNLQRQILHTTAGFGRLKVDSARDTLQALNPGVVIHTHPVRLTEQNAPALLAPYDFVIDATDNFASKFLIADACHRAGKPNSHAGIARFIGQTMTVHPGRTACYRCVFEEPPEEKPGATPQGPLGVVPGVIGTIQATEAIKHLLGIGRPLTDCLLVYDALALTFRRIPVQRNPHCRLCG